LTHREAVRGSHNLVNGHARTLPGQRGALSREIAAHTSTGLGVLHKAERENGGEDDQPGKASRVLHASHVLIIDSSEEERRGAEDCQDDKNQHDDPWRPPAAAMLEDRSLRRRLDPGVRCRPPAAKTDERVVSDFGLAVAALHGWWLVVGGSWFVVRGSWLV
jgi:hypothetical protein